MFWIKDLTIPALLEIGPLPQLVRQGTRGNTQHLGRLVAGQGRDCP